MSLEISSRLPTLGTTIFTVMSQLAQETGAVNLGQGFPDFDCDPLLVEGVTAAMRAGQNQYPPMAGIAALRAAVAEKIERQHSRRYDPATDITITAGATQALFTAIAALVSPGDEVIVLTPCYDSYAPSIELSGATPVYVPLEPSSFRPDFAAIKQAITPKTRAILINSPHNPSATVWTYEEMAALEALLQGTRVLVLSDEVYEHMVFDSAQHQSIARFDGLAERGVLVSSFGKTFHVTGWKVGFVAAPARLMNEFRKVHQFNVFTVNTPMQAGLATFMSVPERYEGLSRFYQAKRDRFRAGLRAQTPFELLACEGSYFQCVRYENVPALAGLAEAQAAERLTRQVGVAAIPLSALYPDGYSQSCLRLCFAKKDATLDEALGRLGSLNS